VRDRPLAPQPEDDQPLNSLESHIDSNTLWLVERHRAPSVGGKLVYKSGAGAAGAPEKKASARYRLRHLNTGRYLSVRSTDNWSKGVRMVRSISAFGGAGVNKKKLDLSAGGSKNNKQEERFIFSSSENGHASACAVEFHAAHAAQEQRGASDANAAALRDGCAVQLETASRWLARGARHEEHRILACDANPTRKHTLALVVRRAMADPAVAAEVLVGVAALPRLAAFSRVAAQRDVTLPQLARATPSLIATVGRDDDSGACGGAWRLLVVVKGTRSPDATTHCRLVLSGREAHQLCARAAARGRVRLRGAPPRHQPRGARGRAAPGAAAVACVGLNLQLRRGRRATRTPLSRLRPSPNTNCASTGAAARAAGALRAAPAAAAAQLARARRARRRPRGRQPARVARAARRQLERRAQGE